MVSASETIIKTDQNSFCFLFSLFSLGMEKSLFVFNREAEFDQNPPFWLVQGRLSVGTERPAQSGNQITPHLKFIS